MEGKEATAYVENAGRTVNVDVESIILEGNPVEEILDFAEKNDIDLIVMGTQGKSAVQRFLIGSVSENVVRHSERSVLVVKGESTELLFKALLNEGKTT
jgi:nucleotide-binding universal stress UspA family protein